MTIGNKAVIIMHGKIEFIIPVDENSLSNSIESLVTLLSSKRNYVTLQLSKLTGHHPEKRELLKTKMWINSTIVTVLKINKVNDLLLLPNDEKDEINNLLKEEVLNYFIKSILNEPETQSNKDYIYSVMNLLKYMNNNDEIINNGAIKREC